MSAMLHAVACSNVLLSAITDSDSIAMMKIYKEAMLERSGGERAAVRW
jgi:hypothetical protein